VADATPRAAWRSAARAPGRPDLMRAVAGQATVVSPLQGSLVIHSASKRAVFGEPRTANCPGTRPTAARRSHTEHARTRRLRPRRLHFPPAGGGPKGSRVSMLLPTAAVGGLECAACADAAPPGLQEGHGGEHRLGWREEAPAVLAGTCLAGVRLSFLFSCTGTMCGPSLSGHVRCWIPPHCTGLARAHSGRTREHGTRPKCFPDCTRTARSTGDVSPALCLHDLSSSLLSFRLPHITCITYRDFDR